MSEDKKDENINSSNENEENAEKVENQPSVDQNLDNSPDENSGENQNISENQVKNDETVKFSVLFNKDAIIILFLPIFPPISNTLSFSLIYFVAIICSTSSSLKSPPVIFILFCKCCSLLIGSTSFLILSI